MLSPWPLYAYTYTRMNANDESQYKRTKQNTQNNPSAYHVGQQLTRSCDRDALPIPQLIQTAYL